VVAQDLFYAMFRVKKFHCDPLEFDHDESQSWPAYHLENIEKLSALGPRIFEGEDHLKVGC